MRKAFKEWAVIVDALGRGDQILILRKGGISEGRAGFSPEHPRFFLFPTLFHQQRESVLPDFQRRYDELKLAPEFARIEFLAEIAEWRRLETLERARTLRGQHAWRDEVIAARFEWGREKNIFALAVRVFRLPHIVELPMIPAYGGCKSWIDLDRDIAVEGMTPVLDEAAFISKLTSFNRALGEGAA